MAKPSGWNNNIIMMELEYRLDLEYTKMPYLVKVSIKIEVAFGFHNCQFQVSARNAFCAVMVIGPQTSAYFCYNSLGQRTLAVEDMNRNGQIDFESADRVVSNDVQESGARSRFG